MDTNTNTNKLGDRMHSRRWFAMNAWRGAILLVTSGVLTLLGCATAPQVSGVREVTELAPGIPAGYLGKNQLPDSLALLPPPPAEGSPAFANDEAVHRAATTLRGTPRWNLAASDAELSFPHVAGTFDCALDISVDPQQTPRLYQLMQRVMVDAAMATSAAKTRYQRTRPFVVHGESTCLPKDEDGLRKDGSYPSGHTALAWALALALTEMAPERTDVLIARGRSYGESRLVCNAHWQSDVLEGRAIAAATLARLHAVPEFSEDIRIAAGEIDRARSAGLGPKRDCAAEAAALAQPIPGVL